jgi:hypothetical protein
MMDSRGHAGDNAAGTSDSLLLVAAPRGRLVPWRALVRMLLVFTSWHHELKKNRVNDFQFVVIRSK